MFCLTCAFLHVTCFSSPQQFLVDILERIAADLGHKFDGGFFGFLEGLLLVSDSSKAREFADAQ